MQLSSFTEYFQVPGLVFGPDLLPLKVKDLVKMKRKKKKSKEKAALQVKKDSYLWTLPGLAFASTAPRAMLA